MAPPWDSQRIQEDHSYLLPGFGYSARLKREFGIWLAIDSSSWIELPERVVPFSRPYPLTRAILDPPRCLDYTLRFDSANFGN